MALADGEVTAKERSLLDAAARGIALCNLSRDLDDLRDRWARRMTAEATEPAPAGGTDDEKAGQT